jgi:oligopeptide transport system substrate-binding protein
MRALSILRLPCWALLAMAAAVAFAGCQPAAPSRTLQPAPDAQQVLRAPLVTDQPLTLDPALATDPASAMVTSLVYPTLMAVDSHMVAHPWAAENVSVSADGLTLTFQLRGGMRFSDGEPIAAQAFAYSLNRALDPCLNAPDPSPLYMIASAEAFHQETCIDAETDTVSGALATLVGAGQPISVVDTLTLSLTLAHPWMGALAALTTPMSAAVPQALATGAGGVGSQWTGRLAAGSGMGGSLFRLAQAPTSQVPEARLTRNPQFWGTATALREIDLYLYPTPDQAWIAYQEGALDIGYPPASAPEATSAHLAPLLRLLYIGLNWHADPLSDAGLRKALALAIDKRELARSAGGVGLAATNHLLPEGAPGYNSALVGPDMTQSVTGNVSQAVKLARAFASSRCADQWSQCPALTLEVAASDSQDLAVAAAIARMWQAVAPDYPLTVRPEPQATLDARIASGAAQLYLGDWRPAYPDPSAYLDAAFGPGATGVSASAAAPDVAALLAQGEAEQDSAQRVKDYQAAEQLLVSAVAWIPLAQWQAVWQTRPLISGVTLDAQGALAVYDTAPAVTIMRLGG